MPDVLVPIGNSGQHALLKFVEQPDGTHAIAAAVVEGGVGGGGGADREIVVTTYRATQNGTGYSVGNVISASRVLDVSGASATQVGATLWFNETTGLALAGAPTSGHLEVAGQPGLTDAQLRSAPLSVVGFQAIPSATFNRPADTTTYAIGDLIANATAFGSVAPMQLIAARVNAGSFILRRLRLRKTTTSLANASFRVHLFNGTPAVTGGDNAALVMVGVQFYIGAVDITMTQSFFDGAFGDGGITAPEFNIALPAGSSIFALLEARGAYAPGNAENFTLTAEVLQN